MQSDRMTVFLTGATGYIGRPLGEMLVARGHRVSALCRAGSTERAPRGADVVVGDALDETTYAAAVPEGATFVHLVGTPHPNPRKATLFESVDLESAMVAARAAAARRARHIVYLSVAQPAPVMRAYVDCRRRGEEAMRATGIAATFLRPWYVLGPGHRWPMMLIPFYWFFERLPVTREGATRLGLVTRSQMLSALTLAVERPPAEGTVDVVDVPAIRAAADAFR